VLRVSVVLDMQDFSRRDEAGSNNVRNSLLQIHSVHTHIFHRHTDHHGWWRRRRRRRRWVVRVSVVLDM
jgi:hypothetical protein